MSSTILAFSLFFHIVATLIWVGGLVLMVILVNPAVRRVLGGAGDDGANPALYALLTRLRQRFTPWTNLALAVLVVTGLTQIAGDPNYDGIMQFENEWSRVILIKHVVIVVMVICGAVIQFGITPALDRALLLLEKGKGAGDWGRLRRREVVLTWVNMGLGLAVIALSVYASVL